MSSSPPSDYVAVLDGEIVPPSWLTALLPVEEPPSLSEVLRGLENGPHTLVDHRIPVEPEQPEARWEVEVEIRVGGEDATTHRIWLARSEPLEAVHLEWRGMSDEDVRAARECPWAVTISSPVRDAPLEGFHRQLRVLAAVAPGGVAFLDHAACIPRPFEWLRDAATQEVPPAPTNLFCIHAVYDEDDPPRGAWLHTHGLLRCGSLELEILDVPQDAVGEMGGLLNSVAGMFLDGGVPEPGETFYAGMDVALEWRPWQEALRAVSRGGLGGKHDRDEYHSHPSAVLFAPPRGLRRWLGGRARNPSRYASVLSQNPMLYVSTLETQRMSRLARLRLAAFRSLFERLGSDSDSYKFLVKIGYLPDGAGPDDEEREHLWFEIHDFESDDRVDATLLNQPYYLSGLDEGDRGSRPLNAMSDWAILSREHGQFGPDTVVYLERELSAS